MVPEMIERGAEYDVIIINMPEIFKLPAKNGHRNIQDAGPLVTG